MLLYYLSQKANLDSPDHNCRGKTVISFHRHRMRQLEVYQLKGDKWRKVKTYCTPFSFQSAHTLSHSNDLEHEGTETPGKRAAWRTYAAGDNISQYLISSYEVKCKQFQFMDPVCSGILPGIQPFSPVSSGNQPTSSCNTCRQLGFSY